MRHSKSLCFSLVPEVDHVCEALRANNSLEWALDIPAGPRDKEPLQREKHDNKHTMLGIQYVAGLSRAAE